MLVIVIPALVLIGLCQGFPEQVPDTATIKDDPQEEKWASLLKDQEAKTASLLRDQEAKTASLLRDKEAKTASLLRKLDNKWASVLRDQQAADSVNMKRVFNQQEQKLSDQEDLLRQQGHTLTHQDKLLRQQEKTLLDQEVMLIQQGQTLSRQASLLQEQGARLSYQEGLLQQQSRTREQPKVSYLQSQFYPDENLRRSTNMSQPKTGLTGKTAGSTSRNVMPRSDDTDPLEGVVSHISQQVTEMGADIQAFKTQTANDIQRFKTQTAQDAQSSTFVHWGGSTCSNLSHTVYSGFVGGSWYGHSGAATNYLCLTMSPVFSHHRVPSYVAFLYGAEYETADSHLNKNPVCSVCRPSLSTTVMIPGTNVCTPGWHLQYSGFLMAGHNNNPGGTQYICVDSKMENTVNGDANEDGTLLYYTVTRCGSLPCSPYINNKVVTCAVCSK